MRTPKNDDQPERSEPRLRTSTTRGGPGLTADAIFFLALPSRFSPFSLCSQVDLTADSVVVASAITIKNDKGGSNLVDFVWCPLELVKGKKLIWSEFDQQDQAGKDATRLEWKVEGGDCMRVSLAGALSPGAGTTVEAYEVYASDLVPVPAQIRQSDKQMVGISNFEVVARDPANLAIESQVTKFYLPSSNVDFYTKVKPSQLKGKEVVYGPYGADQASSLVDLVFERPEPMLEISSVVREITVSSWRDVEVREHYHVKNAGPKFSDGFSRVEFARNPAPYIANQLTMRVPRQAHSLFLVDVLGNITTSNARFGQDAVEVTATPRFPLVPGWQTHFTFGYKLPKRGFLGADPERPGCKRLQLEAMPAIKGILVRNLTINAAVPEFSADVEGGAVASTAFFTDEDPFRTVKAGTATKKWWLDISGRPVRTLELSELSAEIADLTFYVSYRFNDIMEFKEVFMFLAAWLAAFLAATLWSRSDFTLVGPKSKKLKAT